MSMLFIAEKPSVAAVIAANLNVKAVRREGYYECGEHRVTWGFGHLTRLAEPHEFDPKYKVWKDEDLPILNTEYMLLPQKDERATKQLGVIGELLSGCREIILATDPDREGHLIGMWILKYLGAIKPTRRLWLNANDDVSVKRALKGLQPNNKYDGLYSAGVTRALLDQLMGCNLSRAYTLAASRGGYRTTISIGRVQTPTLAMVVRRDLEIESFKAVPYWIPEITVAVKLGTFKARWIHDGRAGLDEENRIIDKRVIDEILSVATQTTGIINLHKTERKLQPPRHTYRLATLQKEANNRWSFSPKKTLDIAQLLYDKHKLISYPRTPCEYLPESQHADAPDILERLKSISPAMATLVDQSNSNLMSPMWNQKKVDEHAHHGIIPTRGKAIDLGVLSSDEQKIYDMIVRSYLAQFFPYYEFDRTLIEVTFCNEVFRASGRKPVSIGWKVLYSSEESVEDHDPEPLQMFPEMNQGDSAKCVSTSVIEEKTAPPPYYTKGSLLEDMEKVHRVLARWAKQGDKIAANPEMIKRLKETAGIGTDATRGDIIETLEDRAFIGMKGKKLVSTVEGRKLISVCSPRVTSPVLTAFFEQELQAIEKGERKADDFIAKQLDWIEKLVGEVKSMTIKMPVTGHDCLKCGAGTLVKRSRKSDKQEFWACNNHPNCHATYDDYRNKPAMNKDGSRKKPKEPKSRSSKNQNAEENEKNPPST